MASQRQAASEGPGTRLQWFTPDGAAALSMRTLAAPRRGSRRAVPPRPRQGAALRPHPRRRTGRDRLPGRPAAGLAARWS